MTAERKKKYMENRELDRIAEKKELVLD